MATKEAHDALELPMSDLDDAMQVAAALKFGANYIITRNLPDYKRSPIPALSPKQFLKKLDSLGYQFERKPDRRN